MDDSFGLTPEVIASYEYQLKHPHDSRKPLLLGVLIPLTILMSLAVGTRFYARRVTRTKYGWDDWMTVLSYLCAMSFLMQNFALMRYYRHVVYLNKTELELTMRVIFASQFVYAVATGFYKAAVLHYYMRIFTIPRAILVIRITLVLVWLHSLSCIIVVPIECKPLRHAWQLLTPGKCINLKAWLITSAAIGVFFDIVIWLIPMPLIWNLNLSRSKRISILGIFLLGGMTVVASIMRACYIRRLILDAKSLDATWDNLVPILWSVTELCLGTICACLPSIWPLLTRAKSSWKSSMQQSDNLRPSAVSGSSSGRNVSKKQMAGSTAVDSKGFSVSSEESNNTVIAKDSYLLEETPAHTKACSVHSDPYLLEESPAHAKACSVHSNRLHDEEQFV